MRKKRVPCRRRVTGNARDPSGPMNEAMCRRSRIQSRLEEFAEDVAAEHRGEDHETGKECDPGGRAEIALSIFEE